MSDRRKIASIVIETIETNQAWKQKAIQACQQGLSKILRQLRRINP